MTWRAVLLGLVLGLAVATLAGFNDQVVGQTPVIGSHFPVGVFGVVAVLALALNPLVGRLRPGWAWRGRELAVAAAVALPACAWPGANLMRYFPAVVSEPVRVEPVKPMWRSAEVFSYVGGASPVVGAGHVRDAEALRSRLAEGGPMAEAIASHLNAATRADLAHADADALRSAINGWIAAAPTRAEADARRAESAAAWPDAVLPAPAGRGLLLNDGVNDEALHGALRRGASDPAQPPPVPWAQWWPTLRLWLGLALLMALAGFAMALIVHPQWARGEQLLYPVARVFGDIVGAGGGVDGPPRRPATAERVFWVGLAAVVAFHGINLAAVYFPGLPFVTRSYNLMPLTELFPRTKGVMHHGYLFYPSLFPIVVALGYFVNPRVALSIWGGLLLWVTMGALLAGAAIKLDNNVLNPAAAGPALRFGAMLASAVMIVYFGRRAYAAVAAGAVGVRLATPAPALSVWAFRGMVLAAGAAVVVLWQGAGVSPPIAALLVATVLALWLVIARIHAETGLFFFEPNLLPATLLVGLLGVRGVGVENAAAIGLAGLVLAAGARESLMPYVVTALRLGDVAQRGAPTPTADPGHATPVRLPRGASARLALPLVVVLVVALPVAVFAGLRLQYTHGLSPTDRWATEDLALRPFDELARTVEKLDAEGSLAAATRVTGLDHLRQWSPEPQTLGWLGVGAGLFFVCTIARLRVTWWPLHPVAFLIWGTTFASNCAFSFLLAGLIKWAVVRCGGDRLDRRVRPFMLGIVAGELAAALLMILIGVAYYLATGQRPPSYHILPS